MSILNRWFEEVWNQGREATIDELLDPNVQGHGLIDPQGNEVTGIESFKVFWRVLRTALPDIHIDVLETVTEGNLSVARYVVTGKHTGEGIGKSPTGNPIVFTGMSMARVKDGKFIEVWNNIDFTTMYQQMK
jgi:predicted ester cyclase